MQRLKSYASYKASQFTESVIREMSRIAAKHGAINLAQGFPDFPAPDAIKEAAVKAIYGDENQYAITWGTKGCCLSATVIIFICLRCLISSSSHTAQIK